MRIPLVDLEWQHDQIADDFERGLESVIDRTAFINGPEVADFERAFASFMEVEHCIGVGSGTDALEFAVRALGLGPGDQVIVPTNSFIASALAVLRAGADVILVDCDPDTLLMDIEQALDAIDETVRAIMPVHLYGQIAPVDLLGDLPPQVEIIEDAAQSQGAKRHGRPSGSFGRVAATSFYPGKNIGAYGDAGAVLTNDRLVARRVRSLGNWGSDRKYNHSEIGFNSRLDTVQSVVLSAKLARLQKWNEARQNAADTYEQLLRDIEGVTLPRVLAGNSHIWHLYVIRVEERDRVLNVLNSAGIGAGVHYPIPMHLQEALSPLGYGVGSFPVAEASAKTTLSLPIYPGITESQQEHVVDTLRKAVEA